MPSHPTHTNLTTPLLLDTPTPHDGHPPTLLIDARLWSWSPKLQAWEVGDERHQVPAEDVQIPMDAGFTALLLKGTVYIDGERISAHGWSNHANDGDVL